MSRWKFPVVPVTVGDNSQNVRKLSAGERRDFMLTSKAIAKDEMEAADLPFFIIGLGSVEPRVSKEEAREMPPELLDACVKKIMELTGMKADDTAGAETDGEKKTANS